MTDTGPPALALDGVSRRFGGVVGLHGHEHDIVVLEVDFFRTADGGDLQGMHAAYATHSQAFGVDGLTMLRPRFD